MNERKIRNLNKILSKSKNPNALLYKVVNNPKLLALSKKNNLDFEAIDSSSIYTVVNNLVCSSRKIRIEIEVA